ncbi:tetratricopeptide repeat-containing sensor histidine kinase [Polaribacter sp. L3A8]|uniref:tetratricopeptide repeat-containing sensor histidine kinase n=1 Tax=Polaribacter sp. L3A8 TaxID=2686361 RepID=UPI00131E333A|nr:tetratricopeptide repeat-containing sensor histidine kinase [Polaribacter sp. L3A8]
MKIQLLLIVFCLLSNHFFKYKKKEVVSNATSSFVIQADTLSSDYLKAKEYFDNKKYTNSLKLALKIVDNKSNLYSKDNILINYLIANIFFSTKNNHNAIKYYKKTISYIEKYPRTDKNYDNLKSEYDFNENNILAESLLSLGSSYYRLNNVNNSETHKDSALYYYREVDRIGVLNDNVYKVKSRAYTNISAIYMNDSIYDKAKYFAYKAIDIHKKLNNKVNEAAALGNLSSIYLSQGNLDEAKKIYFEALDLIRNLKTTKAVKVKEDLYYNLAYNLYKLKDYKAYNFQELSYKIKDSLRDNEFRGMISEITEKYNFDVKKNLLLKEAENQQLKNQRTFWLFGIGSFIVIVTLLYGLNYYKLRQKNLGLQLTQTQLVQNQNLEKIKSESQVRILNATIDGKESERKQIAETLHDSVSALLSSANLHLQASRGLFKEETPVEINKTQKIIMEASQTIRDLSHTLVSSVLLKFGLKYAIKDMADKYSNSQIKIDTRIGKVVRYEQNFEIKVYNIIQEFINNILKHSKAEKAMIKLDESGGLLYLRISDDGIGFDKNKIINKDGLGLNQIDARIQMMEGEFHIDSSKKNGTVIKVVLPILEKEPINLV